MTKQTNPWSKLELVRAEKEKLKIRLSVLNAQEATLRVECQTWLGTMPSDLLTRRETDVLVLLQNNPFFSNKEIANQLNVAERTVKYHLTSLFHKYQVTNRQHLIFVDKDGGLK